MSKEDLTVADLSKMQEQFKSQHAKLGEGVARLERRLQAAAEAIAQVQTTSVAERFKQKLVEVERSFLIPSAAERLSSTTLQLPDLTRMQRELASSLHRSQKVGECIEKTIQSRLVAVEKFAEQTARAVQGVETVVDKLTAQTAQTIKQFEANRARFERLHADVERSLFVASAFNSVAQTAAENFAAEMKRFGMLSRLPGLLEIRPDGAVTLGGESASALEVTEAVAGLCSVIHEPDFFDSLWERLKDFKLPIQAVVLWVLDRVLFSICLGLTINLFTPYIQSHFDQFSFKSRREVTQAIKTLPYEMHINDLTAFRVVTGDRLRLRAKPSMKARVLDELHRGKLVRVIEKRRNWTRVEVQYEDADTPLQGWVATRYIAALRR